MKKIFTLFGLVFALASSGQDFLSNTQYLFFESNTEYAGRTILELAGRNGDTLLMKYYGLGSDAIKYSYIDKRLYKEDSLLFFDFGVIEGDTVVYENLGNITKIRVDSIREITLENGIAYTHFFAHHTIHGTSYTIIEGIGEKRTALGLFHLNTSPLVPFAISACRNDSLIYWDTYGETITTYGNNVDTTCEYDVFAIEGSIGEQTYFPYTIYPNPAKNIIKTKANLQGFDYRIINLLGAELVAGKFENEIDVSVLQVGLYILELSDSQIIYRARFYKE